MLRIYALATLLLLALAGCRSVPNVPSGPSLADVGNGVLQHAASGMRFPNTIDGFTRDGIHQYDAAGRDVSVGYNRLDPAAPVAVTVYVYPSPTIHSFGSPASVVADARATLARGEFERVKNEIKQAHPGATLQSEAEAVRSSQGTVRNGLTARFSYTDVFAGSLRPVRSLAYVDCYVGGSWTIKYRITYPAEADVAGLVDSFVHDFQWTVR